ncbi:DUF1648 domain-containing protein [Streptomyces sp. Ac-502]|uniref:DUF1648 domain-containing protein n=1 Tax=Streptomyces sp. Ac-502 TaxID=3342801 RepID=UPI0038629BB0
MTTARQADVTRLISALGIIARIRHGGRRTIGGVYARCPQWRRQQLNRAALTCHRGDSDRTEFFASASFHRMIGIMKLFSSPTRLWLLSDTSLLLVMTIWGVLRYPHLPDQIPQHIGSGAVDAWADKSIGSVFLLVFVYAGATVLLAGSAELTLRQTPRDEMANTDATPFAAAQATASLTNRPGSRASARRLARALLVLNTCLGISLLVGCGMLWRSTPDPNVPAWLVPAMILPFVAGTAVTIAAAVKDRKQ